MEEKLNLNAKYQVWLCRVSFCNIYQMFGKSELMFDFMSDAKSIHNAKNLVGELNQSMWTDYLTGLSVGLSLKKQILIVSIALDEYTIQKEK